MWNLFSSVDFWVGAALLSAHQIGKFRELGVPDP
jgi:hypothetical protein